MDDISIDFETRSIVNLKTAGLGVYREHHTTDILLASILVHGFSPVLWAPAWVLEIIRREFPDLAGLPFVPDDWAFSVLAGAKRIWAWNAQFEQALWEWIATPRYGWPTIDNSKLRCCQARSFACGLPGKLESAAKALYLTTQKDELGAKVMLKMSQPRRPIATDRKVFAAYPHFTDCKAYFLNQNTGQPLYLWHEQPSQFVILARYCMQDTIVEHAVMHATPPLSEREERVYALDQKINRRGIKLDVASCRTIDRLTKQYRKDLDAECVGLCGWSPTQTQKLTSWLNIRVPKIKSVTEESISKLLAMPDIPADVRRVAEIRKAAAQSSVKKYEKMLASVCPSDDRIRYWSQYHAAGTGRWGGRGVQPHNLPRPSFNEPAGIVDAFNANGDALSFVRCLYGDPMLAASTALRSVFTASLGRVLRVSDFSQIEARVIAWLAQEAHVLRSFVEGKDLYKVAAMSIFNKEYDAITKDERQIGKVAVLACGYQGGHNAFRTMGETYGVYVEKEHAQQIVRAWRAGHPNITEFWRTIQDAATRCVGTGAEIQSGPVTFAIETIGYNSWLTMLMPGGRKLWYFQPAISPEPVWTFDAMTPVMRVEGKAFVPTGEMESGEIQVQKTRNPDEAYNKALKIAAESGGYLLDVPPRYDERKTLTYWTTDSTTKQWVKTSTYGGKLTENLVQAVSRDLLVESLLRVDAAGYDVVLHVHDEIVTDDPPHVGNFDHFNTLVGQAPEWAKSLPMKAAGFEAVRYKKD